MTAASPIVAPSPHGILLAHRDEGARLWESSEPELELEAIIRGAARDHEQVLVQLDALEEDQVKIPEWREAGLTGLCVRVEGHEQALHEVVARGNAHLRRRSPTLEQLREVGALARSTGLSLHVRTRVARSNFRSLEAVGELASKLGAQSWTLEIPEFTALETPPEGVGHGAPRLSLALPRALRALSRAQKRGLRATLRGAPLCLMGPLATHTVHPAQARSYPEVCAACPSRPTCGGVSLRYLERFGDAELRATQSPPAWTDPGWVVANCL